MKITLKAARVNAGLTQNELAQQLGVTKETIIKWEKGETTPDALQFKVISRLSGIPMDYIFIPRT